MEPYNCDSSCQLLYSGPSSYCQRPEMFNCGVGRGTCPAGQCCSSFSESLHGADACTAPTLCFLCYPVSSLQPPLLQAPPGARSTWMSGMTQAAHDRPHVYLRRRQLPG
jgi:hypothetical protein